MLTDLRPRDQNRLLKVNGIFFDTASNTTIAHHNTYIDLTPLLDLISSHPSRTPFVNLAKKSFSERLPRMTLQVTGK